MTVKALIPRFTWRYIAVPLLLICYWLQAVINLSDKSATFDELFHVTGGYTYWSKNDYRLHAENGNLPQRWCALPVWLLGYSLPDLQDDTDWRNSYVARVGRKFFYQSGNDADRMLLWARAMNGLIGVAVGLLIYRIARQLFDSSVACAALVLFTFCPTMLAHGALATSDMTATFFFLASVWCAWQLLQQVDVKQLLLSSLAVSGMFLSKNSAPLVVLMIGLLIVLRLSTNQPLPVELGRRTWLVVTRVRRGIVFGVIAVVHALIAWSIVWTAYGWRYSAMATQHAGGDRLQFDWEWLFQGQGWIGDCLKLIRDAHLLPEAYVYGIAGTFRSAQTRSAFLNGEYSITGWWHFFPYSLMVKTPLPLFVLLALGLLAIGYSWRSAACSWRRGAAASLYRGAPLVSLFIVYWVFALTSHLNIGLRHLLPTYPVMLILAGVAVTWTARKTIVSAADTGVTSAQYGSWLRSRQRPFLTMIVVTCFGLFIADSITQSPNYLAYFNQLAGGPRHGYRHLVDSSLDWGQDLPALKRWLSAQAKPWPSKRYVSYFGSGLPSYYGIDKEAEYLPSFFEFTPPRFPPPLMAGEYCISATMLQQVYTAFPGPWTREHEKAYQQLTEAWRLFESTSNNPAARQNLINQRGEAGWIEVFQYYEQVRFARLCSYLRQREPDAQINHSILVYQVTQEDLDRAWKDPPVELREHPPAK